MWRHGFEPRWDYQREQVTNGPPRRSFYPIFYPTVCSEGDSVSLLQESRTRDRDGARHTSLRRVSVRSTIHNWWPIAGFLSFVLALQVVFANSFVANGKHASDHLQSAEVMFPVAFFLAVIYWAAREARRHTDAWVAGAMVGLAFFRRRLGESARHLGNRRVTVGPMRKLAHSSARPGFDSGHSLVKIGTTAGVAAIVLFIAVLRTHRIVRTGPAIAAAAFSLLLLIAPGIGPLGLLGIVVLMADLCIQRARQLKMAPTPS